MSTADNVDGEIERDTTVVDSNTVQITIRGRPVSLNIPKQYQSHYDPKKQVSTTSILNIIIETSNLFTLII